MRLTPTHRYAIAFALPLAAVGAALFTQYRMDMQPCPWCTLQRAIFVAISLAALPGLLLQMRPARLISAGLIAVLSACGIAAGLWQHFVAASSSSCGLTLAHKIVDALGLNDIAPSVFQATADCAEAAVNLLGVPYVFWSIAIFIVLGALAISLLLRQPARA